VIGGWRKQHTVELHKLYSSPKYNLNDEVKEGEMNRTFRTNGERRNTYRILVGKRQPGRPRRS
jgi:hypothetical protein